jgi:hypothetical protein
VECVEDETPIHPKGEIESGVTQKNQIGMSGGNKSSNKHKWGQGKLRLLNDKEKSMGKKPSVKKVKWDLSKVKCFNRDNNGHLAKEYPKPHWVNDYITQGKLIIQGGFVVKIKDHQGEVFNLLVLNCKINNEIMACFLNLGATKL